MFKQLEQLLFDLSIINHWQEKYKYIINIGNNIQIDNLNKNINNIINGCVNKVWLIYKLNNKKFCFNGDSESSIIKGIIYIILIIFSNKSYTKITRVDFELIFESCELMKYFSEIRTNTLFSIIYQIKHTTKKNS